MEVSGQLHAPAAFTPKVRAPGTHWIGGWVGPRAVLVAVKRKIPSPRRESNPRISKMMITYLQLQAIKILITLGFDTVTMYLRVQHLSW